MGKKQKKTVMVLCVLVAAVVIFKMVTYTTMENEYTVVKQFGKISSINASAGLRIKVPFIQTVNSIPKSMQFYDLPKSDVITSDKKSMIAELVAFLFAERKCRREFNDFLVPAL